MTGDISTKTMNSKAGKNQHGKDFFQFQDSNFRGNDAEQG
jgi:hypothetical protein